MMISFTFRVWVGGLNFVWGCLTVFWLVCTWFAFWCFVVVLLDWVCGFLLVFYFALIFCWCFIVFVWFD